MDKDEIITATLVLTTFAVIIGLCFGLAWVFIKFFRWVDSLPPAPERPPSQGYLERQKDKQTCRDKGGIPITSAWDGRVIDCKLIK